MDVRNVDKVIPVAASLTMHITPEEREPDLGLDEAGWARLARYLAGESAPAEMAVVEHWAATDPARRELLDELLDTWAASEGRVRWDTDAAFARLQARIGAANAEPAEPPIIPLRRGPVPRRAMPWLRAAAAVALLVGGAATVGGLGLFPAGRPAATPEREVVTAAGQRARIVLSDGTEVQLAPGSRLRYTADFEPDGRTVALEGEAYFSVARDPARPFHVHAAGSVTRVLGTRFGVTAGPAGVRVVVEEGRVAFGRETQGEERVELTAGWSARLAVNGALGAPERVDAARALAWKDGRLAFDDAPLTEVAAALARWYGVRVRLAVPRADTLRLTADLSGASVDEAMEIVEVALALEVRSEGSTVVIRRPGE